MLDPELKNTLLSAQQDILSLRRENEILRAKVEVMELFACVLHTQPARPGVGMSEDVAWRIGRILETDKGETDGGR